ncbi:MAG: hypothetical protein Q8R47_05875 [Nanoarchaeota archaeon]|nr:hypothetical protein [Nanoarchaeota archaeon]
MIEFTVERCKTKAAYSAKLKKPQHLDLQKIKTKFETILETPVLLVVKVEGVEIIVHGYGELLFKNCEDQEMMEKIARKIYETGL